MTAKDVAAYIRSKKLNLEDVIGRHQKAKMRFYISAPEHREHFAFWFPSGFAPPTIPFNADDGLWNEFYEDTSTEVNSIRTTYISPALHLNNYLEWSAIDVEWDEVKYNLPEDTERPSNILRRTSSDVFANSLLISIKSGLDRIVRIFSFYYSGFAGHTTWGRYDSKNKASGFMGVVEERRATDQLLAELYSAYHQWIHLAVAPRDQLIHYQDSISNWHFISEDFALVQSHCIQDTQGNIYQYGFEELAKFTNEWYKLVDNILLTLATRLPKMKIIESLKKTSGES